MFRQVAPVILKGVTTTRRRSRRSEGRRMHLLFGPALEKQPPLEECSCPQSAVPHIHRRPGDADPSGKEVYWDPRYKKYFYAGNIDPRGVPPPAPIIVSEVDYSDLERTQSIISRG